MANDRRMGEFLRRGMLPPEQLEREVAAACDAPIHGEDCICGARRLEKQSMDEERDADFELFDLADLGDIDLEVGDL